MSAAAIPEMIDLERLLAPISDEKPAGEFLRYEGTYDRIREARREDDATLTQGIYKTELKKADWKGVADICIDALAERSKDIQISAWLMEAWLRLFGFSGCCEGLQFLTELSQKYWPSLHPQLNEGDPGDRIGTFVWINEKLSLQLKLIPLTAPQSNELSPYSFADWEMACHLEQLAQRDQSAPPTSNSGGQVTLTRFQTSAMLTSTESFQKVFDDLNATYDACVALDGVLEEKLGSQSPGLQRFKDTLGDIQRLVAEILHARPQEIGGSSSAQESEPSDVERRGPGSEIWSTHPIRTRAEAYWRLSEAAEYLLRTEPHSPTPYLVQRAVEWGSMSLSDLLQQIIRNEGEMQEINRLLRLPNTEEGG